MVANAFLDEFDALAHEAFANIGLADMCSYTAPAGSPVERRVYVNSGVQNLGEYGQVLAPRTVIGFLLADGPVVKGAQVVVAGITYVLQAIDLADEDDGSVQWWVVRNA